MTSCARALAGLIAIGVAACGEVPTAPQDAAVDAGTDGAIDAAVDAAIDAPIDAPPTFTVTVVAAGDGTGTVTSAPAGITCGADCTETYAQGAGVTLTAAPAAGTTFLGWSGAGCTGTGTCVIAVTADVTVTAMFALNQSLVVTKTGTGGGTVTSNPAGIDCGTDCAETYPPATTVVLSATPDATSRFVGWSGGGCSGTGACIVTTNAAIGVVATFDVVQHTLTVNRAGTGTGTVTSSPAGINCGLDCTEAYTTGTAVTLTAAPAAGSTFTGWSGAGCSGTGSCLVTLGAAATVTATFTVQQHTLTVTRAGTGAGTVTSSPAGINCGVDCSEAYANGTVVTLTATASTGSTFTGWSGACTGTGTCAVTMTAARAVTATFTMMVTSTCDSFTSPDGTTVPGWTERVNDWFIDAGRLRISAAGGIYSNAITKDGSMMLDGCARFTALHTGAAAGQVAAVVLRWQPPASYVIAIVQDNSNSGRFDSGWIYQMPALNDIGGAITGQNFGTSPNVEGCVNGTTVTLRVDANQDGVYETTRTGTTTLTTPGLAGVMAKSDSSSIANMPRIDNFCWGP